MANLREVSEREFDQEVLRSSQPVLVDFYADWCGPCKMLAPQLEKLAEEYQGEVKLLKVNVDREQGLAARYGIMSIPTLILFKGGLILDTLIGLVPSAQLKACLARALEVSGEAVESRSA